MVERKQLQPKTKKDSQQPSYLQTLVRADETARIDSETDQEPTDQIEDIPAWCNDYRNRLRMAVLPGRNKARNKTILQVFCLLMEQANGLVFSASLRYLSLNANCEDATITMAIRELREQGYLRRHTLDPETRSWRYSLVKDKLPPVGTANPLGAVPLKSAVSGDFSNDAFHNKAFKRNYRLVYDYIAVNPGLTAYAISKALSQDPKTTKKAVEWLAVERLVNIDENKAVTLLPIRERRETDKLAQIAVKHFTVGKSRQRRERFDKGWQAYKKARGIKPKPAQIATTVDDDLAIQLA